MNLASALLGPLVVPECRRALARGWIVVVRSLAGLGAGLVALCVVWWWWLAQQLDDGTGYQPYLELHIGVTTIVGLALTLALVISPALLAGSLAGEKERGSIGLLLTTRVTSREIVSGRLAGKLSQVAMILLAAVPAVVLMSALAGISGLSLLTLFLLPLAVALGAGGIALAASAMSRRGRDALLLVYLLDILFLLTPLVGSSLLALPAEIPLGALNPFSGLLPLCWDDSPGAALTTAAVWTALGLGGAALAAWRLRPTCLKQFGGEVVRRGRGARRWAIPPVGDRPMYWKELYVERARTLGRAGRWIGAFIVLGLALGSTTMAGLIVWALLVEHDSQWANKITSDMSQWIGGTSTLVGFLIQWAIGLRAAVAISSERERGSWDGLLTSPLEGSEIVRGKLLGSMFALRWLILAALWAWSLAFAFGAMSGMDYFSALSGLVFVGALMAAAGVRVSLAAPTATRAMAITIGIWMTARITAYIAAMILISVLFLALMALHEAAFRMGLVATPGWGAVGPGPFRNFWMAMQLCVLVLYAVATALLVAEAWLRFDRIAGRMAGGGVQVAVDRLVHGMPMEPVALGPFPDKPEASPELEPEGAARP
jgi:ABC-type transport system involved in multi-copper enzyme maturation permease subunit